MVQGKPRTAIHHLKAALEADFRYTVALYYIAVEYKHLCMESAELEALNLLIMVCGGFDIHHYYINSTGVWRCTQEYLYDFCLEETGQSLREIHNHLWGQIQSEAITD